MQKCIVTKTKAFTLSASKETVNKNNVTRVSKRTKELTAKIMSLSTIFMSTINKREIILAQSDSHNLKRLHGKINPSQVQNKKQKEEKKGSNRLFTYTNRGKQKTHKKPLEHSPDKPPD